MEVVKITENKDGSATLDFDLTEQEINIFVEHGVIDILKKHIKKLEQDNKRTCFNCSNIIDNETLRDFPDTEVCLECMKDS